MTVAEAVEINQHSQSATVAAQGEPEPFDPERCSAVEWKDEEGPEYDEDEDEETAGSGTVTRVRCRLCGETQAAPTKEIPNCQRCGIWLLKNRAL